MVVLVLAVLGLVVILSGAYFYWSRNRLPTVQAAVAQPAADARSAAILNASGYVTPRRRATIAAKITGLVTAVYAEEGLHVAQGQVLATLDDSDARVRLNSAQADRNSAQAAIADLRVRLANARRELRRTRALETAGIRTPEALDQAQTSADSLRAQIDLAQEQVKAADARIAVARQDLDNATIRAPFAGMVVSKDAQVGEMVSPISAGGGYTRTGIATVVDMKSLEIEVDVNEAYIARVQPGQPVVATLDAYPDWQIPSHVRTIIPTADRQKATVKVRISFNRLDPRILPDMGVKVAFLSAAPQSAESGIRALIPAAALLRQDGRSFVFLIRDGRVEQRAVQVAEARGDSLPVTAGLASGDPIVLHPAGLRDGQRVKVAP
jgi:RND family efflux transporter MFP subunit